MSFICFFKLLLGITAARSSVMFYWVWGFLKFSSVEFDVLSRPPILLSLRISQNLSYWVDLPKSQLLLSLGISKILILFKEINTTFHAFFVQVFDSTQIQLVSVCSLSINIKWFQQIDINIRNFACFLFRKILYRRYFASLCNKLGIIDIYVLASAWGRVVN